MRISTPKQLQAYGAQLSSDHPKLLLSWPLGAGKTTFAKGYAAGLSVDTSQVQSPTYTYINIYDNQLLHIDLYRVTSSEQLHELGILDLIDQYPYILIERPKFAELYADRSRSVIDIQKLPDNLRELSISPYWPTSM